jgi:hypothetical protein
MYAIYYTVVISGYFLQIAFVVSVTRFAYRKCRKRKKKKMMVMPEPKDNLNMLMRQIVGAEYRPGPMVMTKRPELLMAVHRLEKNRDEEYQKYKYLILPILLHPRHEHIRFSPRGGEEGFRVNTCPIPAKGVSKRMRGLLGMQQSCFYPDFRYDELVKVARIQARKEAEKKGRKTKGKKKKAKIEIPREHTRSTIGGPWNLIDATIQNERGVGKALGKQVHEELQEFARDDVKFISRDKTPDPLTLAVIDKIVNRWGMIPIWGELEIWDEVLGYATSVDMVCVEPKHGGRVVFFEVKTGYTEAFAQQYRKVQGNVKIWSNPCGHAMIQLIIPIETMRRQYGIRNIHGYVIHVNELKGVSVYHLPVDGKEVSYKRVYNHAINERRRKAATSRKRGGGCTGRGGSKRGRYGKKNSR